MSALLINLDNMTEADVSALIRQYPHALFVGSSIGEAIIRHMDGEVQRTERELVKGAGRDNQTGFLA